MITGHGGNVYQAARQLGCRAADILDMSSNVNPLGPMPGLAEHLAKRMERIAALPEADAAAMVRAFARSHGISAKTVLAANGSTQFIYTLPYALKARRVLVVAPTYADYADACRMHGVKGLRFLEASAENSFVPPEDRLSEEAGERIWFSSATPTTPPASCCLRVNSNLSPAGIPPPFSWWMSPICPSWPNRAEQA
jgi:threonine-phosphate decarboxylase